MVGPDERSGQRARFEPTPPEFFINARWRVDSGDCCAARGPRGPEPQGSQVTWAWVCSEDVPECWISRGVRRSRELDDEFEGRTWTIEAAILVRGRLSQDSCRELFHSEKQRPPEQRRALRLETAAWLQPPS